MTRNAKQAAAWSSASREAEALLELARSDSSAEADEQAAKQRFLREFRVHVEQRNAASRGWAPLLRWRHALMAAAAVAVLVGAFKFGTSYRGEALSYHSRSGVAGASSVRARQEPIQLDFSDGTVVMVRPYTSVRVTDTTRRGASFLLESGRMEFDVVPHPDRGAWLIQAGPFQVRVTGTVFSVDFSAADGSLRVDVARGHVIVEGAGQRRELGPGDSFHHRDPSARSATPAPAALGSVSEPTQALPSEPEADALHVAEPTGGVGPSMSSKAGSWSRWVSAGEFGKVLSAAAQRGISTCLSSCTHDDLWALANAARLRGDTALAEQAFMKQRSRFAGSSEARAAAFLLGRLAEDRGDPRAIGWYDTYLGESPNGRFAGDVLGRKMVLVAKSDKQRAVALAREYRARFPAGPYASHAKSLIESASAIDGSELPR